MDHALKYSKPTITYFQDVLSRLGHGIVAYYENVRCHQCNMEGKKVIAYNGVPQIEDT